jgi:hypothetical protein
VRLSRVGVDSIRKNSQIFDQQLRAIAGGANFIPVWNFAYPEIKAID